MNGVKKCPKCGADLEENARFCYHCMTSLDEKEKIVNQAPFLSRKTRIIMLALAAAVIFFAAGIFSVFHFGLFKPKAGKAPTGGNDFGFEAGNSTMVSGDNADDYPSSSAAENSAKSDLNLGAGSSDKSGSTSKTTSSSKTTSTGSQSSKTTSSTSQSSKTSSSSSSTGSSQNTSSNTTSGGTASSVHTHTFSAATCQKPAICSTCGAVSGTVLSHDYINGECKWCGRINSSYYSISYSNPITIKDNGQTLSYSITSAKVIIDNGDKSGNILTFSYVVNSVTGNCKNVPFDIYYYDKSGNFISSNYRCSVYPFYTKAGDTGSFSNLTVPDNCKLIVIKYE